MASFIDEIKELENRLKNADLVNDPAFHELHVADDVLFTDPQGRKITKADIIRANQPPGESKFTSLECSDVVIQDHNPVGIVSCRMDIVIESFVMSVRLTRVWRKYPTGWKILACQVTAIADN